VLERTPRVAGIGLALRELEQALTRFGRQQAQQAGGETRLRLGLGVQGFDRVRQTTQRGGAELAAVAGQRELSVLGPEQGERGGCGR